MCSCMVCRVSTTLAPAPQAAPTASAPPRRRTRVLALPEARWALVSLVAFLAALPLDLGGAPAWTHGPLYAIAYAAGGWEPALEGLRALREKTLVRVPGRRRGLHHRPRPVGPDRPLRRRSGQPGHRRPPPCRTACGCCASRHGARSDPRDPSTGHVHVGFPPAPARPVDHPGRMQTGMHTDTERCVRAVRSKDARFDGWFFTAVLTTRIYCRPSCPVVPPKPGNMPPQRGGLPAGRVPGVQALPPGPAPARPSGTSAPTSRPAPCA
ncbi:hypothetical protein STENM36S_01325 [Streptomyces tendae]